MHDVDGATEVWLSTCYFHKASRQNIEGGFRHLPSPTRRELMNDGDRVY